MCRDCACYCCGERAGDIPFTPVLPDHPHDVSPCCNTANFRKFQMNFLLVYLIMTLADWMQVLQHKLCGAAAPVPAPHLQACCVTGPLCVRAVRIVRVLARRHCVPLHHWFRLVYGFRHICRWPSGSIRPQGERDCVRRTVFRFVLNEALKSVQCAPHWPGAWWYLHIHPHVSLRDVDDPRAQEGG